MKTPDEIKNGLKNCMAINGDCKNGCPYYALNNCSVQLSADSRALINALLADLTLVCGSESINPCLVCSHYRTDWEKPGCELNGLTCAWSWRGVQDAR